MTTRAQRPFWMHQLIEYIIGFALIALGFQDPEPVVPAVLGVVVLLNAAVVHGPLGAFRMVTQRVHRWLDLVVIAILLAAAVQPWFTISVVARAAVAMIAIPMMTLWWYTDWASRAERKQRRADQGGDTAASLGRAAGNLAGRTWRDSKRKIDEL